MSSPPLGVRGVAGRYLLSRLGELLREFGLELVSGGGGSRASNAADADSTCCIVTGALPAEMLLAEGVGAGYSGESECEVIRFLTLDSLLLDSDDGAEPGSFKSFSSLDSAEPMENSDDSLRPALFFGALNMVPQSQLFHVY